MTSSIVITDRVKIEFDKKGKFKYTDTNLHESYEFERKEIPFVRYRFNKYGMAELGYIRNSLQKFNYSAHLAEVNLSDNTVDEIELISSLEEVAIFLYIDLYKDNILAKNIDESTKKKLNIVKKKCLDKIERVMLKDKDGMLHMLVTRPIIKNISLFLGIPENKIGFCSCAFSMDGMCCLTAERARDIAARYSKNERFAIATNAVEGKNIDTYNGCYCIRHIIISHDVDNVEEKKEDKEIEKDIESFMKINDFGEVKENKPKQNKVERELNVLDNYVVERQLKFNESGKIVEDNLNVGTVDVQETIQKKKKLKIPKKAIKF